MKINQYCTIAIIILMFFANACRQNSANTADSGTGGAENPAAGNPVAETTAAPNAVKAASSELTGGVPVAAKRDNLTAEDRAAFLRAIGLDDYAERSATFVSWWSESYGTPLKNAGVTFHALGGDKYLVEIMVDQGANLSTSVYALYQENAGQAIAKLLELEGYDSKTGEIVPSRAKEQSGAPVFDEQNKVLTITAPSRGTGGCGERVKYQIAENRARLIEARYQECSDEMVPPEKWKLVPLKQTGSPQLTADGGNGVILNEADFQTMSPTHAAVLKRWLRLQTNNLRPVREDKNSISSQKYFRRDYPNDDPFYAVGDFNGNGVEDFAVILTGYVPKISPDTKRSINSLAVFEMSKETTGQSPKPPYYNDQIDSLFIIASRKQGQLGIASYPSDDGFLLVPKGSTYTVKPMVDF